jgi:hypothetical protein
MAYMFIDENSPEEREYCSNYIYFNEKEPGALKMMMKKCLQLSEKNQRPYKISSDDSYYPMLFA